MRRVIALGMLLVFAGTVSVFAAVESITVRSGTDVVLAFDQGLNSKTAKVGDTVRPHVKDDVFSNGKLVIARGTPATGVIARLTSARGAASTPRS
jgi:hypothetical protein